MKRRTFITIAGLGGALAMFASAKIFFTPFEDSVVKLLRRELHFLKLDEAGVRVFAKEYSAIQDRRYKLILKAYHVFGVSSSRSGKVHQLVSNYLLSSDFFTHKMDESRVIKYVALYNPFVRPCAHPFSTWSTNA